VENEATSATTRQYTPQQPANPYDEPYQSQLAQAQSAPDNRFDNQAPETSRLYQASMAQNYYNYPVNYQQAPAKKSGALKWVLITLFCILLVSGGIGAMVISAIRAKQAAARQAQEELSKALERAKEAARAAEEMDEPPPPPASGASLEQYKYPNAEVKFSVDVLGNEFVTMITTDSVSVVGNYYKKKLGDPMVEGADAVVIFHLPGPPTIFITINQDENDSEKTQITVLPYNIQLPKMN
jgi:hypothetical protein